MAIKSGWDCFGVKYAKPTRNVTVRNITCDGSLAGIAIGSEVSGGRAGRGGGGRGQIPELQAQTEH